MRCRARSFCPARRAAAILLFLLAVPSVALAQQWSVRDGDVRVLCPLTIGGSFEAKTSAIGGALRSPASPDQPWPGELSVDLGTLDTGIALRNQHLRETYLEVPRGPDYARALLSDIRIDGLQPASPEGRGTFTATLKLHGMERTIRGQVELRRTSNGTRVQASFPVVLEQFGIAKPRYLGVGVADTVTVRVRFTAAPSGNP